MTYMEVGPLLFSVFSVLALFNGGSVSLFSLRSLDVSRPCSCFSVIGGSLNKYAMDVWIQFCAARKVVGQFWSVGEVSGGCGVPSSLVVRERSAAVESAC